MYYINKDKKKVVGRNNQAVSPILIDFNTLGSVSFQAIDSNNKLLNIPSAAYYIAGGLKGTTLFYSNTFGIASGILTFVVDTYTEPFLDKIKKKYTEIDIEIGSSTSGTKSLLLRDVALANPRVYIEGLPPAPLSSFYTKEEVDSLLSGKADKSQLLDYLPKNNPTGTGTLSIPNAVINGTLRNGNACDSKGNWSHAEGNQTSAYAEDSHTEGFKTKTLQNESKKSKASHAEGYQTVASGIASHAEGYYTKTGANYQHVMGKYNKVTTDAFVIGGGGAANDRKNIFTVDWNGDVYASGVISASSLTISNSIKANSIISAAGFYDTVTCKFINTENIINYGSNNTLTGSFIGTSIYEGETLTGKVQRSIVIGSNNNLISKSEDDEIYTIDNSLIIGSNNNLWSSDAYDTWKDTKLIIGDNHIIYKCYGHDSADIIIGNYSNIQQNNDDPKHYLLIAGNGSNKDERSNALTIDYSGNVWTSGIVSASHFYDTTTSSLIGTGGVTSTYVINTVSAATSGKADKSQLNNYLPKNNPSFTGTLKSSDDEFRVEDTAMLFGTNLEKSGYDDQKNLILGNYNDSSHDGIIVIGNGYYDQEQEEPQTRQNSLTIDINGNIQSEGNIYAKGYMNAYQMQANNFKCGNFCLQILNPYKTQYSIASVPLSFATRDTQYLIFSNNSHTDCSFTATGIRAYTIALVVYQNDVSARTLSFGGKVLCQGVGKWLIGLINLYGTVNLIGNPVELK